MRSGTDGNRDVLDRFLRDAAEAGQPAIGEFELTSRCNLRCRMCYIAVPADDALARSSELCAADWVRLTEDATRAGMLFLQLSGGEPLLRTDFLDIYEPITGLGLCITLRSNATLVTPELAARLGRRPPARMMVTLYGASPETYQELTGHAEGFSLALRGIDLLRDAGVNLGVIYTLTRANLGDMEAAREITHARGLTFSPAWGITPRVDGASSEATALRLSPEEVITLESNDPDARASWGTPRTGGRPVPPIEALYCYAGRCSFTVSPSGEMNPCVDLRVVSALPLRDGFDVAWQAVRAWTETVPDVPQCVGCEIRDICPTCPAHNLLETGSLTGLNTYACAIARARAQARAEVLSTAE